MYFSNNYEKSTIITEYDSILCDSETRCIYINDITDLGGKRVIIPQGFKLVFDGGCLRNGTLVGKNTEIDYKEKCFDSIRIEDTWLVPYINSEMFCDLGQVNDIINLMALANPNINNTIIINQGVYNVEVKNNDEECLMVPSNTDFVLKGIIRLLPNDFKNYNIVRITGDNVRIRGGGTIIGDKNYHKGKEGQWGMGIFIYGGRNIVIEDISIKDCWGDCIYIGGNSDNVIINNCCLDNGRRQGVSITSANIVEIKNSVITNIKGHAPETGIDIEPNEGQFVNKVVIDSVSIVNCVGGVLTYGYENKARVGTILVKNCNIVGCKKIPFRFYGCKEVEMIKCSVEVAPGSEGIQKEKILSFKNSGFIFRSVEN